MRAGQHADLFIFRLLPSSHLSISKSPGGRRGKESETQVPTKEKLCFLLFLPFLSCTSRSLPFDRQSRRRKVGLTEKVKLLFSIATLLLIGLLILVRLSLTIRLSMMVLLNWGLSYSKRRTSARLAQEIPENRYLQIFDQESVH